MTLFEYDYWCPVYVHFFSFISSFRSLDRKWQKLDFYLHIRKLKTNYLMYFDVWLMASCMMVLRFRGFFLLENEQVVKWYFKYWFQTFFMVVRWGKVICRICLLFSSFLELFCLQIKIKIPRNWYGQRGIHYSLLVYHGNEQNLKRPKVNILILFWCY